jgi:hypothetical protein
VGVLASPLSKRYRRVAGLNGGRRSRVSQRPTTTTPSETANPKTFPPKVLEITRREGECKPSADQHDHDGAERECAPPHRGPHPRAFIEPTKRLFDTRRLGPSLSHHQQRREGEEICEEAPTCMRDHNEVRDEREPSHEDGERPGRHPGRPRVLTG